MHVPELLKPLLRQGKLTDAEWVPMLEHFRATVNPYLDKITLPKFGALACIDNRDGFYREIYKDNPKQNKGYSLEDHGFTYFSDDGVRLAERGQCRHIDAFGLAKDGKWVLVKVEVEYLPPEADRPGGEKAREVTIWPAQLDYLLKLTRVPPLAFISHVSNRFDIWENRGKKAQEERQIAASGVRLFMEILTQNSV